MEMISVVANAPSDGDGGHRGQGGGRADGTYERRPVSCINYNKSQVADIKNRLIIIKTKYAVREL